MVGRLELSGSFSIVGFQGKDRFIALTGNNLELISNKLRAKTGASLPLFTNSQGVMHNELSFYVMTYLLTWRDIVIGNDTCPIKHYV